MRKFRVYLDVPGKVPIEAFVKLPNSATENDIHTACSNCLVNMIANELDAGWYEIETKGLEP